MTEGTPIDPLPGEGPPQAVPPAATPPTASQGTGLGPPATDLPVVATDSQERTFGMLCHLSALGLFVFPAFGNIVGPLIVWLIKKDEFPFVDDQGKESLNFQISMTIYTIVSAILMLLIIGIFLLIALGIFWIVVVIIASVRANEGKAYRYPLTIRFIN